MVRVLSRGDHVPSMDQRDWGQEPQFKRGMATGIDAAKM